MVVTMTQKVQFADFLRLCHAAGKQECRRHRTVPMIKPATVSW
jgi:hypothetical protein